jgi:hypothetical protein
MATDNPKISGYVPQAIYDKVMHFKTTRGCASVSQAVTAILEEYFGLGAENSSANNTRLEALEGK